MKMSVVGPPSKSEIVDGKDLGLAHFLGVSDQEFMDVAESILITILHRPSEGVQAGLIQAAGFWARSGTHISLVEDQFGGFIEQTRANMARLFLQACHKHEKLKFHVMIDNDQTVSWDAPYKLALWNLPVVSGVVCTYSQERGIFACFTVKDRYGKSRFPSFNFTGIIPGRGLIEANSTGTGLLCVKKDTYTAIYDAGLNPFEVPEATRKECFAVGTLKMGEDIAFSRQCESLGIKVHVDLSVHAIHYKTIALDWPAKNIDYSLDVRDWQVSPHDRGFGDA